MTTNFHSLKHRICGNSHQLITNPSSNFAGICGLVFTLTKKMFLLVALFATILLIEIASVSSAFAQTPVVSIIASPHKLATDTGDTYTFAAVPAPTASGGLSVSYQVETASGPGATQTVTIAQNENTATVTLASDTHTKVKLVSNSSYVINSTSAEANNLNAGNVTSETLHAKVLNPEIFAGTPIQFFIARTAPDISMEDRPFFNFADLINVIPDNYYSANRPSYVIAANKTSAVFFIPTEFVTDSSTGANSRTGTVDFDIPGTHRVTIRLKSDFRVSIDIADNVTPMEGSPFPVSLKLPTGTNAIEPLVVHIIGQDGFDPQSSGLFSSISPNPVTIPTGMNSASAMVQLGSDSIYSARNVIKLLIDETKLGNFSAGDPVDVTIKDNRTALIVSTATTSVNEDVSNGNFTLTFELTTPNTQQNVTFDYSLVDISATKGVDYTEPAMRSESIDMGSSTTSVTIDITDDTIYEGNESFKVVVSNISGAVSTVNTNAFEQEISITDDDDIPAIEIISGTTSITEGDNVTLDFTVQIFQDISHADPSNHITTTAAKESFVVKLMVTEEGDFDFLASANEKVHDVTFAAGMRTANSLSIPIVNDKVYENALDANDMPEMHDGAIKLTLMANTDTPGKYTITTTAEKREVSITVQDDDSPPVIEVADMSGSSVMEGETFTIQFNVDSTNNQSTASGSDTTIRFSITDSNSDLIAPGDETVKTVVLPKNMTTVTTATAISTQENMIDRDNPITITIENDDTTTATYTRSTTQYSEPLNITDNDNAPVIQVSASTTTTTEGEAVTFTYSIFDDTTRTTTASANKINIRVGIVETTGDFIDPDPVPTSPKIVELPALQTETTDMVTSHDDEIDEDNGSYTLTILIDSNQSVHYTPIPDADETMENFNEIVITVNDNDIPKVSISSLGRAFETDGSFMYMLSATPAPYRTITINVTIMDPGNVISGTPDETIDMTTSGMKPETIMLINNMMTDPERKITITVAAGTGYEPEAVSTPNASLSNTVEIFVRDAPTPVLSISAGDPAKEGDDSHANFTITSSSSPPNNTLIIKYLPVSEGFLPTTTTGVRQTSSALTFSTSSPYTATLPVQINDDDIAEINGSIKVTIEEKDTPTTSDYLVGVGAVATATIIIIDDDSAIPELSISGPTDPVFENAGSITLTITASLNPGRTLIVDYTPSDEIGDFLASAIEVKQSTSSLTFAADGNGNFASTLEISINDNNNPNPTGEISATLELEDTDNDALRTYTLATTGASAMVAIFDNEVPELTIANGVNTYEVEGATANFIVTASFLPTEAIAVRYTPVSEDFLADGESNTTVTADPALAFREGLNGITADLRIEIDADSIDDPDGTIMVTLEDDTNPLKYTLGSAKTASVTVSEYELSIANGIATEGKEENIVMNFVVTLSAPAQTVISVNWSTVEDSGESAATAAEDFVAVPNRPLEFAVGDSTKNIEVIIQSDDDETEPVETFTVTLSGQTLGVRIIEASAKGQILPNNAELTEIEVAITPNSTSVPEGTPATFTLITLQGLPSNGLEVKLNVTEMGSFIAWRTPRSIKMTKVPEILSIATQNDLVEETTGSISVEIIADSEPYSIAGSQGTAMIMVTSDDVVDPAEPPVEQPRIAVAQAAVDTILTNIDDLLGGTSASPPIESTTVSTRPTISISVVNTQIEEGAAASFLIMTKNGGDAPNITVSLQVHQERVNIAGPANLNVQLQGQNSSSLSISTLNDDHAGEDGFVAVTILEDPSYMIATNEGVATVSVSDAVDRQNRQDLLTARVNTFMPDVVGNMAARRSEIITQRVQQGFSESNNNVLNFGGIATVDQLITRSGERTNEGSVSWRELLGDSSFAITLLSGDDFVAPTSIWGIGDRRNLTSSSSNHAQDWTGDTFTGQLGIDTLIGEQILTGVSAAFSENDIEIDGNQDQEFEFSLNSTSLNPYIGWTSTSQNAELQAVMGYGVGELTIDQSNYNQEALASRSYSLALAGSKELYSSDTILNGITKLSVIGDSWFARQYINGQDDLITDLQTDAQYYNIRTEGTHQYEFEGGHSLTPLISVGIRKDTKNQLSTLAIEFTGGLDYDTPIGLTFTSSGHLLVADENTIQKMSVRSTLGYDRGNDDLGLTITVSPKWGQTLASAQNTLWNSDILTSNNNISQYTDGTQVNTKVGYGFVLGEHSQTLTVYSGYEFDDQTEDELLLGSRVAIGSNFGLDFKGTREISTSKDEVSKFKLKGRLKW